MGLDVAEFGVDANVTFFRYGGFVERPTIWSGVDAITTRDRAAEKYKARIVYRANYDGTGVGAGVAPHMQRLGSTTNRSWLHQAPPKRPRWVRLSC
jgi:hypothetical protein